MKNSMPEFREVNAQELASILERAKTTLLGEDDHATLKAAVDTLALLTTELQSKRTTLDRLRRMLFGAKTEKANHVLPTSSEESESGVASGDAPGSPDAAGAAEQSGGKEASPKAPGHGRSGAAANSGAKRVKVPHPAITHNGQSCLECEKGRVYPLAEASLLLRITGMAPLGATIYECARWRCNLCGEVFTASPPAGVSAKTYDETATAMVGMLKYGTGVPFNRIQKLQKGFGILLSASKQWEIVRDGAKLLTAPHAELKRQAAQGEVLYNDDTPMTVLSLTPAARAKAGDDKQVNGRTGVFTSGIASTREERKIALFLTGPKHAGENLEDLLAWRAPGLPPPIQMCDALSRNFSGDFKTILAKCITHARRKFVDVVNEFPEECRFVIETLGAVYKNDARTRRMSKEERLLFHQTESAPHMEKLEQWLTAQIEEHKVEPNSGLGEAIGYMRKHWPELTLFLRVAGAPLDNNLCERILKKAILHRKNAMFYKTLAGAAVGDKYMSLIHTCELNGIGPFEYLVALFKNDKAVAERPSDWMPWNYQETLAGLVTAMVAAA